MIKKIADELNKCINTYPDLLWKPDVEPVKGQGNLSNLIWWRCSIKKYRLGEQYTQYTHLHFTPHSVSDVNLEDLHYAHPITELPFFNTQSGNIIPEDNFKKKGSTMVASNPTIEDSNPTKVASNSTIKDTKIKQLVLVSSKNNPYGPLYTGKITNPKKFIEFSNGSNKYYVPRTCYYPLLKEDAVNECKWGDDIVYKAMKEMYEALLSYFQKKNGISIF